MEKGISLICVDHAAGQYVGPTEASAQLWQENQTMAGTIPWWAGPPREVEPSVVDDVYVWAPRSPGWVFVREGSQDALPGREGAETGSGREKCCCSRWHHGLLQIP